jgi:uncharacterized OB-fold protein
MQMDTFIGRQRPVITEDIKFFWDAANRRELVIQRCTSCGTLRHPPLPSCPHCLSFDWDSIKSNGKGELMTYTVVHRPIVPPFKGPYVCGLVALEEGTRIVSQIVDVAPANIVIGMALIVDFVECGKDFMLPVFRPFEDKKTGKT